MSTLVEIETAIARLGPAQWLEIRRWMDEHAPKETAPALLPVFRQLQREVGLTAEAAIRWKKEAVDARR